MMHRIFWKLLYSILRLKFISIIDKILNYTLAMNLYLYVHTISSYSKSVPNFRFRLMVPSTNTPVTTDNCPLSGTLDKTLETNR